MDKFLVLFLFAFVSISSIVGNQKSLALTIYNDGFGVVKDVRLFLFEQGTSKIYFTDVAATIQTQTVTFKPKHSSSLINVFEQNFERNLISKTSLLTKFLEKTIDVEFIHGIESSHTNGTLLRKDSSLIIQRPQGQVLSMENIGMITLKEIPEGFFTKPTLNWKVSAQNQIQTECEVVYQATGFSWRSDYTLILDQHQVMADLGGWVTIDNQSGKTYKNAKLKLIAGIVNIIPSNGSIDTIVQQKKDQGVEQDPVFEEKSFSDYHLYTLSQRIDLTDSSQKQIEFIPRIFNLTVLRYNEINIQTGGRNQVQHQVKNIIEFCNSQVNNPKLGIPFPKGIFRVFKTDSSDGSLEFIGEDRIDHTPKNQNVKLKIGNSFDIVSKLYVQKKQRLGTNSAFDAQMRMELSNHGNYNREVRVRLNSYYGENLNIQWEDPSIQLQRNNNELFEWTIIIHAGQKETMRWKQHFSGY